MPREGMGDLICMAGFCDRPAVAAVYAQQGGSILIRPDHVRIREPGEVGPSDDAILDWRCIDCLHHEVDRALGLPGHAAGDVVRASSLPHMPSVDCTPGEWDTRVKLTPTQLGALIAAGMHEHHDVHAHDRTLRALYRRGLVEVPHWNYEGSGRSWAHLTDRGRDVVAVRARETADRLQAEMDVGLADGPA